MCAYVSKFRQLPLIVGPSKTKGLRKMKKIPTGLFGFAR